MKKPPTLPPGTIRSILEVVLLGAGFAIIYGLGATWFLQTLARGVRAYGAQLGPLGMPAMVVTLMLGLVAVLVIPVGLYREINALIIRTRPVEHTK